MKNIVSTMVVFGVIFLIIVIGAYVFDKFNGFGLIEKVDTSINDGIQTLLNDKDNDTSVSIDNNKNTQQIDNKSFNQNSSDNTSSSSIIDNVSIIDNNTQEDNVSTNKNENINNTENANNSFINENEIIQEDNQEIKEDNITSDEGNKNI